MNGRETMRELVNVLASMDLGEIRLMEVCGTHTMSIARSGIKSMIPKNIKLISGPGCPVCVTAAHIIDKILKMAVLPKVTIVTYGDMVRVPGSSRGDSLGRLKAGGADIRVVFSPVDAVEIARENPDRQVVFLGVGFETTAPGTGVAIKMAKEERLENFSVFSMLKTVEPALRALMADNEFNIQGFICPGHVATVIGERGFEFFESEYNMPAVIAGFEPQEIMAAICRLAWQISKDTPRLENAYTKAVAPAGNRAAMAVMEEVFIPRDDVWRGLGPIQRSGLRIRDEYREFDAETRFAIEDVPVKEQTLCRCGEVIQGKISPRQCPLFAKGCSPELPVGPCMVSGEGACAAEYNYNYI
ncbi:MAG: hydrogenase formation protein HypD [Lachnospiraceae bacterium]|jgi:hydrogenase expression/formation protein HypD